MNSTPTPVPAIEDLARTQQAWNATYTALAASPAPSLNTLLRRRLLRLSTRLARLRRQTTCQTERKSG
ncbi:hypothetical protein [Streptomyces sp. 150FB]|uniref:hypothetical protein n=1 Tax=Streptomyces sp. 150FB TaxID=1576605 RepID=UPI000695CD27|nr:hypothetical protein [Streptomyces sp. 150FB]